MEEENLIERQDSVLVDAGAVVKETKGEICGRWPDSDPFPDCRSTRT